MTSGTAEFTAACLMIVIIIYIHEINVLYSPNDKIIVTVSTAVGVDESTLPNNT